MKTLFCAILFSVSCACLGAKDLHLVDGRVLPAVAVSWDPGGQLKVIHGSGVISISPTLLSEADRIEFNLKYPKPAPVLADTPASPVSGVPMQSTNSLLPTSGAQRLSPSVSSERPTAETATTSRWTISSTGKRHNSGCRYYGKGSACGPAAGVACKICGG